MEREIELVAEKVRGGAGARRGEKEGGVMTVKEFLTGLATFDAEGKRVAARLADTLEAFAKVSGAMEPNPVRNAEEDEMTKVEFVARSMYGRKAIFEDGDPMEKRAALAIEACEEWDRREKGLEGEAKSLRGASHEAWGVSPSGWEFEGERTRNGWLAVARKAREMHGKVGV